MLQLSLPPRAEKLWQNAEEVDDGPSEWRGGPWFGAGVVCTDAGISRAETGLVHFSLMGHNTGSAQSRTVAGLMIFKRMIWAQMRFRLGHKTEMLSLVQNTVAGLAEEGKLRTDTGKKQREKEQCDPALSTLQMYSTGPVRFGEIQTEIWWDSGRPLCITAWKKRN